jgi:hypothetical protein
MTQAPAAIFKIPTESPQPARGRASRARKAVAPKVTVAGESALLVDLAEIASSGDVGALGKALAPGATGNGMS